MTVKIAGHWETAWRSPLEEFNDWWHPLKEFGIDEFYMSPVTGIAKGRVLEKASIDDVFRECEGLTRVYVDESSTIELPDFVHPENALYIFGRTTFSPYLRHNQEGDLAVKIPTVVNQGGFWGHTAAAVLMYDRFLKGGF
jgi:hypothetical protein